MSRTIPAAEWDRILNGTGKWEFRLQARRPDEAAWTDLTDPDWVLAISVGNETPDRPVGEFTARFIMVADGDSLSPGDANSPFNQLSGAYAPLLYPGCEVRVDAANLAPGETRADAIWRRWLEGDIEDVEWPSDEVLIKCETLDGRLYSAQIEAEETRGLPDPGRPVQDEIQGLANRWVEDPPTLYVPVDPDWGVGEYIPEGNVGDQSRTLAQRRGWDVRFRWDDSTGAYRWTMYLPPRDKTTIDITLDPEHVSAIPGLKVRRRYVRNAFTGIYWNPDLLEWRTRTLVNQDSIDQFRRRHMKIVEEKDSSITNDAQMDNLLGYANSDLSDVHTEKRVRIPFNPWVELHDRIAINPDGFRFTAQMEYSTTGISHEVTADDLSTVVDLRGGSPVGQYYDWLARGRPGALDEDEEPRTPTWKTWWREFETVAMAGFSYQERGLKVVGIEWYAQIGVNARKLLATTPSREEGDLSLLDGSPLLLENEQEYDYPMDPQKQTKATADMLLEDGTRQTVSWPNFDPDKLPNILDMTVDGNILTVIADADTYSLWAYRVMGDGSLTFIDRVDSNYANFDIPLGDTDRWLVRVFAYDRRTWELDADDDNVIDVDAPPYNYDEDQIMVTGINAPDAPWWDNVAIAKPADLASLAPITLDADRDDVNYSQRVRGKAKRTPKWIQIDWETGDAIAPDSKEFDYGDITDQLVPVPGTVTDAASSHDWDAGFGRVAPPGASSYNIELEIVAEIVEDATGLVMDTRTVSVAFSSNDAVPNTLPQVEEFSIVPPEWFETVEAEQWRILVHSNHGGSQTHIGELEFLINDVDQTDPVDAGTKASASSQLFSSTGPEKGFDDNNSNYWGGETNYPEWLAWAFGVLKQIEAASIQANAVSAQSNAINGFDIQYSKDAGATWEAFFSLATDTDPGWIPGEKRTYPFYDDPPAGHPYWRVYVHANNGASQIHIAEVELLLSGVDQTDPAKTVPRAFASTAPFSGNEAHQAFDDDTASKWVSNTAADEWIGWHSPKYGPVDLDSFSIRSRGDDFPNFAPKDFDLQYSDDGQNWVTVKSVVGETGWAAGEKRTYAL